MEEIEKKKKIKRETKIFFFFCETSNSACAKSDVASDEINSQSQTKCTICLYATGPAGGLI